MTIGCPRLSIMMLAGLRSRWMIFLSWAYCRARATVRIPALAGVVHRTQVGVLQRGGQARLAEEPVQGLALGLLVGDLEGHGAPRLFVLGEEDDAHAALAQFP